MWSYNYIVKHVYFHATKEPHDWRTLFGSRPSWMPALGKHWARVDHYRNINRYSSNNYSQVAPREQEIPVMDVSKKEQPAQSFYVWLMTSIAYQ